VLHTGTDVDEALAFLPTLRDGTAGWGYSQGYPTDINSTALVVQAYVAAGVSVPSGGFAALRTSQLDCGAWPYQPGGSDDIGATIGAILGILRRPLPVRALGRGRHLSARCCAQRRAGGPPQGERELRESGATGRKIPPGEPNLIGKRHSPV